MATRVDKNQAVIDFLLTCPQIQESPLFFNFTEADSESKQIVTEGNDTRLNQSYLNGDVLKRYTFTIIDYRSVAYQAIINIQGYVNENVEEMLDCQGIIDWVNDQEDIRNYPDFGDDCEIDEIKALTLNPNLNSVQSSGSLNLAKYSIAIQIDYIDKSKRIW